MAAVQVFHRTTPKKETPLACEGVKSAEIGRLYGAVFRFAMINNNADENENGADSIRDIVNEIIGDVVSEAAQGKLRATKNT